MDTIIKFAKSDVVPKIISGTVINIILFCGIDVNNRCSIVGFEYTDKPDNVCFLFKEIDLITSWRTMNILEGLEHIDDITIAKCWHLAKIRPESEWNKFANKDGSDAFLGFIPKIFNAYPPEETSRSMRRALALLN